MASAVVVAHAVKQQLWTIHVKHKEEHANQAAIQQPKRLLEIVLVLHIAAKRKEEELKHVLMGSGLHHLHVRQLPTAQQLFPTAHNLLFLVILIIAECNAASGPNLVITPGQLLVILRLPLPNLVTKTVLTDKTAI